METKRDSQSLLELTKNLFGVVREALILAVLLLLFLWPTRINKLLIDAGFTTASIAGFEWKRDVLASAEQTKVASQSVTEIGQRLDEMSARLAKVVGRVNDPVLHHTIDSLSNDLSKSSEQTKSADASLKTVLGQQEGLIAQFAPENRTLTGWIYLGLVTEKKQAWAPGHPKTIQVVDPALPDGTVLRVKDDTYLRDATSSGNRAAAAIMSVLRVGEEVSLVQKDYSHARGGGWFVWAKVSR